MKRTTGVHRTVVASSLLFLLAGCGTFQLASNVTPNSPKTPEQQQLDSLACKDQAQLEANTTERQTGAFLLGMTIVGAPVAFELEKAKQREVFKSCMEARGYRVLPPVDQPSTATSAPSAPAPSIRPSDQPRIAPVAPPVDQPLTATSAPSAPPPSPRPSDQARIVPAVPAPQDNRDEAVQLQKLKGLRDKGLITEEEYQKKRKEILDRL